ncbi:MAG: hypothetical protein AAGJ79_00645 [Verrucomicrobiota bacterium]
MPTVTAEIIGKEVLREFSCGEHPLDIFDGYALFNGKRHCISRRWVRLDPEALADNLNSKVTFDGEPIEIGEDPRPFTHEGGIGAVSCVFHNDYGFRNHLFTIQPQRRGWFGREKLQVERAILIPPLKVPPGKNWSPFSWSKNRLAFIHSFSPLIVLIEKRREMGVILLREKRGEGIPMEEGGSGDFPAHRGGTNGVRVDNLVCGFGHTTRFARDKKGEILIIPGNQFKDDMQAIHRPFLWCLDPKTMELTHHELDFEWDEECWIIDPTSLIYDPQTGRAELYTTEVERNFSDPSSRGKTVRYEIVFRTA